MFEVGFGVWGFEVEEGGEGLEVLDVKGEIKAWKHGFEGFVSMMNHATCESNDGFGIGFDEGVDLAFDSFFTFLSD